MHILLLSIASIFVVLGIDYFIKELIKMKLKKNPDILVYQYKNEDTLEYSVRRIRLLYPDSEIYIVKNIDEKSEVLEKLSKDYSNIHSMNI